MNSPSPPVGPPTEAPRLDEQIAYIGESIDGECGCFMCRHNRAILASLEELQRLKSTHVAAERLIRRLEDSRDNACLEGSVFHRLFSDCIAALRAPAAKGRETDDAKDAARRYGRLLAAADNAFRTWNAEPRGLGPQADSMLKLGKAIAEGAGNE